MATWTEICYTNSVAALSDIAPLAVGTVAAEGSNAGVSRYDHVHTVGTGAVAANTAFADNIVDGAAIADDAINSAELATMTGNVDFNDQQANNMCVHNAADAPTAVVGKVYYHTDDNKLYVCTGL